MDKTIKDTTHQTKVSKDILEIQKISDKLHRINFEKHLRAINYLFDQITPGNKHERNNCKNCNST